MSRTDRRLRILIADDHELVRQGIRYLVQAQSRGKVVGEAADGRKAVEKAKQLTPDLAIVDISMPLLDGIEVIRQVREVTPNTRIVILSMHESDRTVREVLEAGGQGYVLKSDLASYLVKAVKAVFRGEIFLTPRVSKIVLERFVKTGKEFGSGPISENGPTAREVEIIRLLGSGKANKEVARKLGITVRTVETHRAKIMRKLGLHSITQLLHYAIHKGILTAQDF